MTTAPAWRRLPRRPLMSAHSSWRRFGSGGGPATTRARVIALVAAAAVALAGIAVLATVGHAEGASGRGRPRSGRSTPVATDPPSTPPPPTTSAAPATPAPAVTRRETAGPEDVAASFAASYLTFRWADGPDAVRERCRPWDTDEVDAALAAPGMPPDQIRRAAGRETDDVVIRAVAPEDLAGDHLDASLAATVRIERDDRPARSVTRVINVRVVATPAGWAVAQVTQ